MDKSNDCETLSRELGVLEVFCIVSGAMISSGLFVLPAVAYGKMGKKTYSTNKIGENNSSINDLLLFTVYCGIFFSFLILIWNIRSEYWNLVMSCFGIIIIVLIIIFIFLLKKRWKFKKF